MLFAQLQRACRGRFGRLRLGQVSFELALHKERESLVEGALVTRTDAQAFAHPLVGQIGAACDRCCPTSNAECESRGARIAYEPRIGKEFSSMSETVLK